MFVQASALFLQRATSVGHVTHLRSEVVFGFVSFDVVPFQWDVSFPHTQRFVSVSVRSVFYKHHRRFQPCTNDTIRLSMRSLYNLKNLLQWQGDKIC